MTTTVDPEAPPPPQIGNTSAGHVALLILGSLIALLGLALAGAATASGIAAAQQRDGRFLTTPTERYVVESHALTTTQLEVLVRDDVPAPSRLVRAPPPHGPGLPAVTRLA